MYTKTHPAISFAEFRALVIPLKGFKSLTGKEYAVLGIQENEMHFIRKSTNKKWSMNLESVHHAYLALTDFKTENFRPYVPRTHSPALGLLLHLDLLKR
ncbi:hypothetical protein ACHMWN_12000 [Pedobacter sp. UC225_61]|uniref:hypothetical protein n=1 Tax=Pedobacter sp. UC225_61 TaxID=3374623 RepID=UPI003796F7E8